MIDRNLRKQAYLVSVEKKDGSLVYLRLGTGESNGTLGTTTEPAFARQFNLDTPKEEILAWVNRIVSNANLSKQANINTLRIMLFETQLTEISVVDDYDWRQELQRNGVAKLTHMEIEALGLEKFEIERKMARS